MSAKSVQRYENSGMMMKGYAILPLALRTHMEERAFILKDVFLRGQAVPLPPALF